MIVHKIGDILYINGADRTEKLTIKKVGKLYATFEEAPHRLILEKETVGVGLVELKKKSKWDNYTIAFDSATKAEDWLKEKLKNL
jgi:hypothetical protein